MTAAQALPGVDPEKVFLYGIGHAGAGAIIAAADDPRIAGLLLQSPAISGRRDETVFGKSVIERAWKSRQRRTAEGDVAPEYIQPWATSAEQAADPGADILFKGEGPYGFISEALKESEAAGTPWENKVSLQSILYVIRTEAKDFLHKIEKPTLYVAHPNDPFTGDAAFHEGAFRTMGPNAEFKLFELVPGPSISETFLSTMDLHLDFVRRTVGN